MNEGDYYLRQQQALLDVCKDRLWMLDGADLALDNKLSGLIGLSSISLALITLAISPDGPTSRWVIFPVIGGFMVLMAIIILVLRAWRADSYPIPAKLNIPPQEINDRYVVPDPGTVYSHLAEDYLDVAAVRKASTIRKGDALNRGLVLYAVQLVLLALAVISSGAITP